MTGQKTKLPEGLYNSRLYQCWASMKRRCYNKNVSNYTNYGGRGIKVCLDWHTFILFYNWAMANGYDDTLQLDRIDNNGDYTPDNCKWSTVGEQARNRRSTIIVESMCLKDYCIKYKLPYDAIRMRMSNGRSVEEAINFKDRRYK